MATSSLDNPPSPAGTVAVGKGMDVGETVGVGHGASVGVGESAGMAAVGPHPVTSHRIIITPASFLQTEPLWVAFTWHISVLHPAAMVEPQHGRYRLGNRAATV